MQNTNKAKELKITLGYFAVCALIGFIANLIYPLDQTPYLISPNFVPDKIFNTYLIAPAWVKYALAVFFISFTSISVYGRINTNAGRIIFSRIPPDKIRKDVGHIIKYTLTPIFFTVCYFTIFIRAQFNFDPIP
jgi:hypothetical protein